MPLIIPKTLPAYDALYEENVFVTVSYTHLTLPTILRV